MTAPENTYIGIVGGGLMGAGIAQVFACAGYTVKVYEPTPSVRQSLLHRIESAMKDCGVGVSALDRIEVCDNLETTVRNADYVTEAVPERLDVKRRVFTELISLTKADCVLASNTSVIPITKIADGIPNNHRIVGTHWWNPPYLVPLVEVVPAKFTDDGVVSYTLSLLQKAGKQPAHIRKDVPGFVANRLQHALWREAIAMVADGVCDAATLDHCVKNSFGLRLPVLGPLENADLVGLDLTLDIHRTIMPELNRSDQPHPILSELIGENKLGFKTGEGFQTWSEEEITAVKTRLTLHLLTIGTSN